ncbi:MAG: hypothetical protein C0443_04295 [Comamonadaceae bacterium]|nr:hypothetical protein [Comamonadaceae bacterium]
MRSGFVQSQPSTETSPASSTLRPELPAVLTDILARTMVKTPERRYQTGADLAADLQRAVLSAQGGGEPAARAGDNSGSCPVSFEATHAMARPFAAENVVASEADTVVLVRAPNDDGSHPRNRTDHHDV